MIRKYHNQKLPTTPRHREEEPLTHHETPGRQIKQSNQLSLPHQDDCNTRGLNAFYWYQIFAQDSAVVEVQEIFSSHGSRSDQGLPCLLTGCSIKIRIKMKTSNQQPLKEKWTVQLIRVAKSIRLKWVKYCGV